MNKSIKVFKFSLIALISSQISAMQPSFSLEPFSAAERQIIGDSDSIKLVITKMQGKNCAFQYGYKNFHIDKLSGKRTTIKRTNLHFNTFNQIKIVICASDWRFLTWFWTLELENEADPVLVLKENFEVKAKRKVKLNSCVQILVDQQGIVRFADRDEL